MGINQILKRIQTAAKLRHEHARKRAKLRGRVDFPLLPYECSWAFEEEFKRSLETITKF